ncbi:MAG: hypothetical protein H6707_03205 [Deltaproteobacteria bacterium]|nr:hypothetical protein [Deltaproteobacteria bacterium]
MFQSNLDDQLAALRPSGLVKAAAVAIGFSGGVLLLGGVQLLIAVRLPSKLIVVPYAMALIGLLCFVVALKIYRLRPWAPIAGMLLSVLICIAMGLWFLFSSARGFISLLALGSPLCSAIAAVLSAFAIGPARQAAATRARLAKDGLDVDF